MKQHSETETLHENEFGQVLLCGCCNDLQLHFGNVLIQMPIKGVENLHIVIQEMAQRHANCPPNGRFIIRTPQKNMSITASKAEFAGLIELIDTSLYMYEVKKVLQESE